MPRPKRKKIKFTEESVNNLFQEIYDENHNLKAQITRLFTKWVTRIKEDGNIAAIGDQVIKVIAAQAKNQDQKIMILKYLKEVVFNEKSSGGTVGSTVPLEETGELTTDRRNELLTFVHDGVEALDLKKKEEERKNNN